MTTYHITIDASACTGFGSCVDLDPDTFAMGDDGIVTARVNATDRDAAVAAARACPMTAISVVDDTGAKVV
ncbi:MAG: ferredoxin [Thermoleophilia bacterium]